MFISVYILCIRVIEELLDTGGNVVRGDQKLCKRSPYESVQI